jgi:hypothetical protein
MGPDMELVNDWHVVAARRDVDAQGSMRVRLLERDIDLSADASGALHAAVVDATNRTPYGQKIESIERTGISASPS